ncbi:GtrA family protein [Paenibacillus amylolyticus]|uniref:GtrA family protein n=1 Tax=Paenibacillus amylolyticus TaxID=1451 RepID=A0A5M9WVI0_PAEAM|nr:GtrA family protein [Paenibacillus amylolyticus]
MKIKIDKNLVVQIFSFGLIGVLGTIIHTGSLLLLVEFYHYNPLVSSAIGFTLSLIVSYFLNIKFTFNTRNVKSSFIRYSYVSLAGLLINLTILFIFQYYIGGQYMIGQFIAIIIVPFFNFVSNKYWTFKST